MNRFKIMVDWGGYGVKGRYIILDRKKLKTPIRDKRLTFDSFETYDEAVNIRYHYGNMGGCENK